MPIEQVSVPVGGKAYLPCDTRSSSQDSHGKSTGPSGFFMVMWFRERKENESGDESYDLPATTLSTSDEPIFTWVFCLFYFCIYKIKYVLKIEIRYYHYLVIYLHISILEMRLISSHVRLCLHFYLYTYIMAHSRSNHGVIDLATSDFDRTNRLDFYDSQLWSQFSSHLCHVCEFKYYKNEKKHKETFFFFVE